MKLKNINARFTNDRGRNLAMQLMGNVNESTLKQLKFIGDSTNVDLKAIDVNGMNVVHYLTLNSWNEKDNDDKDDNESDKKEDGVDEEVKDEKTKKKEKRKRWCSTIIKCGEYLLSKGVDIDQTSENGTPLVLALKNGNKEFGLWLLEKGVSIKIKDAEGNNILALIIKTGLNHGVVKLLKKVVKANDSKRILEEASKEYTKNGDSFSHQLIAGLLNNGKERMLKLMKEYIKMGLDFSVLKGMTEKGYKDCEAAREKGYTEDQILKLSLEKDKSETTHHNIKKWIEDEIKEERDELEPDDLGMFDYWNGYNTEMHYKYYKSEHGTGNVLHFIVSDMQESSEEAEKVIKLLCDTKNDFDKKNLEEVTPLALALLLEKKKFAKLLLNAKFDPNAVNGAQMITCVHLAATYGDAEILNNLIKAGGKIDARDALGNTAVHYAAYGRNLQTMEVLLKAGADINAVNDHKNTPLHISFAQYNDLVVNSIDLEELMFNYKPNPSAINENLRTPFFYAFMKYGSGDEDENNTEDELNDPIELTTKVLEIAGYDLNMQDVDGNTVLHFACKEGTTLSVLTMVKAGAKLDIQNKVRNTPLAEALLAGRSQLCIYLLQEAKIDLSVYEEKHNEPTKLLSTAECKKLSEETVYEKHNIYWHAIELNDDGVLYMLKAKGFPRHKAIKTAIKQKKIQLATKLFNGNKESLKAFINKKDGMNLCCYFAYHYQTVSPSATQEFLNSLTRAGVDPLSKSKDGMTTIHAAAITSAKDILKTILDPMPTSDIAREINTSAKMLKDSNIKYNPISFLVYKNSLLPQDLGVTKLSIKFKEEGELEPLARSQIKATSFGFPPYQAPTIARNPRSFMRNVGWEGEKEMEVGLCLSYLLQLCYDRNINIPIGISFTANDPKLKFANYHLYSYLFNNGTTVETTLLHYAVMLGNTRMAACLIGMNFVINEKDSEGRTPLMYAVLSAKHELVKLLCNIHSTYGHKQKVNLNDKDKNGKTALMFCVEQAIIEGNKVTIMRNDILTTLLEQKAKLDIKDNNENTFVDLVNALPGNEAYVEIINKKVQSLKTTMNSFKHTTDIEMADKPKYDFNKDYNAYLEKKHSKKKNIVKVDDKVKADSVSKLEDKVEVVKGDE
jgi:ankyrin repeat protein